MQNKDKPRNEKCEVCGSETYGGKLCNECDMVKNGADYIEAAVEMERKEKHARK